jgi:hypothetical protein
MNCTRADFLLVQENNLGASQVLANDPALSSGNISSDPVEISTGALNLLTDSTDFLAEATDPLQRVLFPSDLGTVNNFLSIAADYSEQTTLFNHTEYPQEDLLMIIDNIIVPSNNDSWRQLDESTERIALSFASNLNSNPNNKTSEQGQVKRTVELRNAVFTGILVDVGGSNQDVTVAPNPHSTFQNPELVPNITLPIEFLRERNRKSNSNYTPIATTVIRNLQAYLPLRFNNGTVPASSVVGSIILSTQVSTFRGYSSALQQNPVIMNFPINRTYASVNVRYQMCVSWDFISENVSFGGWSDDNITTRQEEDSSSHVQCNSRHLTTFAVLVDVAGLTAQLPEPEALAFSIVSYIGCAVSLVCLTATVVFLLSLRWVGPTIMWDIDFMNRQFN